MKGICFIKPLFHATIEGRKTETRRIVKSKRGIIKFKDGLYTLGCKKIQPKYKVGEIVYLKEPYCLNCESKPCYKYDKQESLCGLWKWKNKLFMPEKYAQYFIEITGVRYERLKDISDEDCMKEGIQKQQWSNPEPMEQPFYVIPDMSCELAETPQAAYAALINHINGKGTWESNPYVWVYDYKLLK